jgi:hypothetical protein
MMTDDPGGALAALVLRWIQARPLGASTLTPVAQPVEVPADLLPTVTRHEPWRSRVLADAAFWLAAPRHFGLGLEVLLEGLPAVRAEPPWQRLVAPLRFRTSVVDRMDPWTQQVQERRDTFARVGCEDGAWKLVALWEDDARTSWMRSLDAIRTWARRQGGDG